MNNYLRDIHSIFVAKDVFEKTFYIARKSGICECKVIEIGLCIAGDNREHGYVKLLIAGEDEPFVTSNTLGYAAFPALDKIYGSWMDCVKGVDSCKVFDVVSGTCIGDGVFLRCVKNTGKGWLYRSQSLRGNGQNTVFRCKF